MKRWKPILILLLAVIVACSAYGYYRISAPEIPPAAMNYFRGLKEVEFCSMDPADSQEFARTDYGLGEIDGFHIAGTSLIEPKELLGALGAADRANNTTAANCFWPRHAIRDPDNHDNYFLICFKCYQVRYSFGGESGLALITDLPRDLFNSTIDEQKMDRYAGPDL